MYAETIIDRALDRSGGPGPTSGRPAQPAGRAAGTVLLEISNVELIRRTARIDPGAARALYPYALWCAFATALNADIAPR